MTASTKGVRGRRPAARTGRGLRLGTGWLPDEPDPSDLTWQHAGVAATLRKTRIGHFLEGKGKLPGSVDLRRFCPPVRFQGGFNTCSAHVVAGLVEFFEKKAFGAAVSASRLFLYKATKNLLQAQGTSGVYIRQTMGALKLIGVPPEKYWPYPDPGTLQAPRTSDARLDEEPPAFCYAVAADYRAVAYYRLDQQGRGGPQEDVLMRAKAHLASSIPVGFGFPLHSAAVQQSMKTGAFPYPAPADPQVGNHAVIAVGYDDELSIDNTSSGGHATKGALLIQNSWSTGWGQAGYGWLPYEYVLAGAARDFWTLTKADWVDSGAFQLDLGT